MIEKWESGEVPQTYRGATLPGSDSASRNANDPTKAQNKKPAEKPPSKLSQYAKGGLKAVGGAAAVFVVATNPEIGVAGALIGVIGGSASFVSGTTQIIGTATNTDTKEGTEAVEAYGSPQGLVVGAATGGNQSLAAVATTAGDLAGLVGKPEGAVGVVDKVSTAVDLATGGLKDAYQTIRNFISPPAPPSPPTPGLPLISRTERR